MTMIKSPFSILPAAINHLLAQEPWARAKLVQHAGKVACIDGGIAALRLAVGADGMVEAAPADATPAVTIRVKLSDLPLILQNRERAFSYVRIEGDADFANTISQVSQGVRWEVEEDLSKVVGDIAANRIAGGARAVLQGAEKSARAVAGNIAEFLTEEQPVLVHPQAVQDFTADVTRMRDDVERLAKRIAKLKGSGK